MKGNIKYEVGVVRERGNVVESILSFFELQPEKTSNEYIRVGIK